MRQRVLDEWFTLPSAISRIISSHTPTATPLVLQLNIQDHTQSLDDPYIDTVSDITNYHSDIYIGSTCQICSPIIHISITQPLYQLIQDNSEAKRGYDVHHRWISTGCNFSIQYSYCLSAGMLIPGRRLNDYSLMLQWFIPREMRCRRYHTTMASRDMQCDMRDRSLTSKGYIWVLSTEWTYMN